MKIEFIPYDYDHFSSEGKTYIRIFGSSDNKKCCVIDEAISFFYVLCENPEKIAKKIAEFKESKTEIVEKNFLEKKVKAIKVYVAPENMKELYEKIKQIDKNIETKEKDINLVTRYIIEKKLKPLTCYEIEAELARDEEYNGMPLSLDVDFVLNLKKAREIRKEFSPKVLAFDIEAEEFEIGKGEILMISLVSENFKKVLTHKKCSNSENYVECLKDEAEMLEKFEYYIKKLNPDIITGYFSDGFDFPYIRARAEKNKVDLKLGKDNTRILFSRGKSINARIKGIVHVDLLKFIQVVYSQYLQSETLSLDEVAKELIGEGKQKVSFENLKEVKDWSKYFSYCLNDSTITYKLFTKLWPEILEFTRIISEPLYEVNRDSMSQHVENYIIHNLERFNEIIERRPIHEEIEERKSREKYEGAFVFQPLPGLYENLAVFDFASYLPSIIVTFNLSKSTLLEKKESNSLEVDIGKKVYFSKKEGFFSKMLGEIIEKRKEYKKEYSENPNPFTKARSNAFKLLANASYGYQGFFGARYYCPEAAAATTAISQKFIKTIIDKLNNEKYSVIYSDTDSCFFKLNNHSKKEAINFLDKLNSELPGIMKLDLEDFYERGIWVTKRTGEFGAKKKYALINDKGKIKIRGFETIRRDWCTLARETQNKILLKILNEGNEKSSLEYLKKVVSDIKNRKISKEEVIIRTQLKKPINEYLAESPHVTIAKRMKELSIPISIGTLISFYIAESKNKKSLIRERAKLPEEKGEYDIDYYLNNQILPAVENIFQVFKINVKEIIEGKRQTTLF